MSEIITFEEVYGSFCAQRDLMARIGIHARGNHELYQSVEKMANALRVFVHPHIKRYVTEGEARIIAELPGWEGRLENDVKMLHAATRHPCVDLFGALEDRRSVKNLRTYAHSLGALKVVEYVAPGL